MQPIRFSTVLVFLLTLYSFFSIGNPIKVNLKAGEVLIYEWNKKEILKITNRENAPDWMQTNRFSIAITNRSGEKLLFTAQMLKKTEQHLQAGDIYTNDYAFPELKNYFWKIAEYETYEAILYPLSFKYEMDLTTGAIELTNRVEILEQCFESLNEKGYSEEFRSPIIERINTKILQQQSDMFLTPFILANSDLDQPTVKVGKTELQLSVVKRNGENMELEKPATDTIYKPSVHVKLKNSLVTSWTEETIAKPDGGSRPFLLSYISNKLLKIKELKLIKQSAQKPDKLIVCGHIESPVNDHITLYTLNRAFGTDPDSKDVYLDQAGNFKIETKLKHAGLVILAQPNKKQNINTAAFLLYAEPGDSIYIKSTFAMKNVEIGISMGKNELKMINDVVRSKSTNSDFEKKSLIETLKKDNFPTRNDTIIKSSKNIMMYESVEFSGDRNAEAEFLMNYQQEWGLPPYCPSQQNVLLTYKGNPGIDVYLKALDKLDQMLPQYQGKMNTESYTFIKHELQALLYGYLCEARPTRFFPSSVPGIDLISVDKENQINNRIDSIDIQQIYNDYGIFSRNLAQKYVSYKYNQLIPISTVMIPTPGYLLPPDLERMAQFTKMVLSGSALYRTLAHQLYSSTFVNKYFTQYQKVWQPYAIQMLELIRKRSNDNELNEELDLLFRSQLQWTNTRYIPETQFLNLKRQKVSLKSVIAGKPSIIFIGDNWSATRYEMDEMVPKFPGFNFVLLNEGTNFDLWKGWNDRAESLSHQLFLLNDSIHLADVFQDKQNMFIVYNAKGERIGVEHEMIPAIQMAKDSLKSPKKEINKSTLQGIIIVLAASLLFFLILFLAYKYRMKQRLKKQTQEKRLRELQMAAIRAQMNPHFLFNSLNSVQNLIQQNRAGEAHLYLSNFAWLIRKVLRNSDKEEVSLAEELETLEQYLNLEKLRFDFDYSIKVDEGIDQNLFMLPAMILQPLAENALMHGLQHKNGEKRLFVTILKKENTIQISVEDNGIGIDEAKKLKTKSNGVGLRMNEERILMMKEKYGGNYSFRLIDLTEQNGQGTRVEINIPEEI
jgi:hypothetical protein